jgi:hypothetical protein
MFLVLKFMRWKSCTMPLTVTIGHGTTLPELVFLGIFQIQVKLILVWMIGKVLHAQI